MSREHDNSAHWLRELADRLGEGDPIVVQWKTDMAQREFLESSESMGASAAEASLPPVERRAKFGKRARKLQREERRGAATKTLPRA